MPLFSTRGAASSKGFGFTAGGSPFLIATGGTVTTSGDYKIHTFTSSSTFVVSKAAKDAAGGNGVRYLIVGAGGSTNSPPTVRGGNSSWNSISATGGGYGGEYGTLGSSGGSGGGSGGEGPGGGPGGSGNAGGYSPPEGFPGGSGGGSGASRKPGAGGGASQAAADGGATPGGNGVQSDITGTNTYYAGGGGGGSHGPGYGQPSAGNGGLGGGGNAELPGPSTPGTDGLGGGAGGNSGAGAGGAGGLRTITTYTTDVPSSTYPVTVGTDASQGGDGVVILAYKYK
jgi:hypothetical protein